jgi:hypothetical protein
MRSTAVMFLLVTINVAVATHYEVGPGMPYQEIEEVPWEMLMPGDTVSIHWRSEPYRSKWVICRVGTQGSPIVVRGIANQNGVLPVISGEDARTRSALNFWNEERGVIKIGGANKPPDTMPQFIIIQDLDIRTGRPGYHFTGRNGALEYVNNCAAVYIEKGKHIIIRGCILHDCGNGIFAGHPSEDVTIEYCKIYDNGIENRFYEHNTYTEVNGIIYQYNYFGSLRSGCQGNNLKDRSAGTIIRYNWIENGNRQLDLVDSGHQDFIDLPTYRKTYVYGNVLLEADGEGNSQMIHYGGDSGDETHFRQGTLYLYNNTIVSTRSGNTTLVRLSSDSDSSIVQNNIIHVTADGSKLAMKNTDGGVMTVENCVMKPDWTIAHGTNTGHFRAGNNTEVDDPGFVDVVNENFALSSSSVCIDAAGGFPWPLPIEYFPVEEYVKHRQSRLRPASGELDIGAYEYESVTDIHELQSPADMSLVLFPQPASGPILIMYRNVSRIVTYNLLGRIIDEWDLGERAMGVLKWQPGGNLKPGTYIIRAEGGGAGITKKLIYTK